MPHLHAKRLLCYLLCQLMIVTPVAPLWAAGLVAGDNRTQIIAGNVPTINIATPNQAGVSHNHYQQFNVATPGVVLNNATQAGNSQLAGQLNANPQLAQSGSANLIINEVTGGTPSQLQGKLEIFGKAADLLIANPNGISCNGCSFINTPGLTLTTGQPQLDVQGALTALTVQQGNITIGEQGLNATAQDYVDIISRTSQLNGQLHANNLNLIQGANQLDFANGTITASPTATNAPTLALDSKAIGGMYANKIRLLANENGVGVNLNGTLHANDIALNANGKISVNQSIQADNTLNIQAPQIALATTGQLHSQQDITLASQQLTNQGQVIAQQDLRLFQQQVTNQGESARLEAGRHIWLQKDAQANKAERVDNLSGKILTQQGDLMIRSQIVNNQRQSWPTSHPATALSPTSEPIALVGKYQIDPQTTIDNTSTTNQAFQQQYPALALTIPAAGNISAGNNLYINSDQLTNSNSLLQAKQNMFLAGRQFINQRDNLGLLLADPNNKTKSADINVALLLDNYHWIDKDKQFVDWQNIIYWSDTASLLAGKHLVADFQDKINITTIPYRIDTAKDHYQLANNHDHIIADNIRRR